MTPEAGRNHRLVADQVGQRLDLGVIHTQRPPLRPQFDLGQLDRHQILRFEDTVTGAGPMPRPDRIFQQAAARAAGHPLSRGRHGRVIGVVVVAPGNHQPRPATATTGAPEDLRGQHVHDARQATVRQVEHFHLPGRRQGRHGGAGLGPPHRCQPVRAVRARSRVRRLPGRTDEHGHLDTQSGRPGHPSTGTQRLVVRMRGVDRQLA